MFERACVLVSLCLLGAVPLAAQEEAALQGKLDSIAARYLEFSEEARALRAAEARADAAKIAEPLDTAFAGPFRIVARKRELAVAVEQFDAAWTRLAPVVGSLAADIVPHTFLVSVSSPVPVFESMLAVATDQVWLRRWRLGPPKHAAAEAAIGRVLYPLLPEPVRLWSGAGYFDEPRWTAVYRELAMSSAIPSRRCFAGDEAACLAALALDTMHGGASGWYSPVRIRARALANAARLPVVKWRERDACAAGDDRACLTLLPPGSLKPPLSSYPRLVFAQLAIARGGPGSFERLARDTSGNVATALAAAARVPLEQLARDWRAHAMRARPPVNAGLGATVFAAFFWVLVFVALATRSTRCRTG